MTRASPLDKTIHDRPLDIARALLAWYEHNHRTLPWRIGPAAAAAGARPDPYHVWLSEVMLQQTTVAAVRPYFLAFVQRWPAIGDLAAAPVDSVMQAWAGLGYYSRARNLKACAETIMRAHGGVFPRTQAALRALPGIGEYTAAAVAAIAFGQPAAVVDGNVERVMSRLGALRHPPARTKAVIHAQVAALVPLERPGDFAQAMMDLGATICTPRRPACDRCPLTGACQARRSGRPEAFPPRAARRERPLRTGAAFVAVRGDGAVLMRKRADKGLLGGMAEVPTSNWTCPSSGASGREAPPFAADWEAAGTISHVFTHFRLQLDVFRAETDGPAPPDHWWSRNPAGEALPSVMKKALEAAMKDATRRQRQQDQGARR